MPLLSLSTALTTKTELIHNWSLLFAIVVVATLQGVIAYLGGKLTFISLPPRYRRRYRRHVEAHRRYFYAIGALLSLLTILIGLFNDHILMSADRDTEALKGNTATLKHDMEHLQAGMTIGFGQMNSVTMSLFDFAARANSTTASGSSTMSRTDIQQQAEKLASLEKRYIDAANNLRSLATNTHVQTINPIVTAQPIPAAPTPTVPTPTSPEIQPVYLSCRTSGINQTPNKPIRDMNISELRISLNQCIQALRDVTLGTSDLRTNAVHEVANESPNYSPRPEDIQRYAPQIEEYNKRDAENYMYLRPTIIALRAEALSRLKLPSNDGFNKLDHAASTPAPPPTAFFEFNASMNFASVSAYLSELDNKLSKLPQR